MSWKDYGWSEDYDEPSFGDLDPREWAPFDWSWSQNMLNPNNASAGADWFWFDVGLTISWTTYLASARTIGFYAAWDTAGGLLTTRMLTQPARLAGYLVNPFIAIPVGGAILATMVNEYTREMIASEHKGKSRYTTPFTSGFGTVV